MRRARFILPVAAIAALGAIAYAERPVSRVAEYRLPDGGIARVRYTGDVAPRLVRSPADAVVPMARLDRIATMMDAQADAMLGATARMQPAVAATSDGAGPATVANTPAGTRWTSIRRTMAGGRLCTTEVSTLSQGASKLPVTRHRVSGDCAAPLGPATPARPAGVARDSI